MKFGHDAGGTPMTSVQERRAAAVEKIAPAIQNLDKEAQVQAVQEVSKPSQWALNIMWLIFVPGLLGLIVLFAIFSYNLTNDANTSTDPAVFVEALTFALGALVGLFVPSPKTSTSGG
jgi:hypothetical protein